MKLLHYIETKSDWISKNVLDKIYFDKSCIILLDTQHGKNELPPKEGINNLIAVDSDDNIIWIADIPKSYPMFGSFFQIVKVDEAHINAICDNIHCLIEINSGKIVKEKFIR